MARQTSTQAICAIKIIRNSKGHQDRVVPLPTCLYQELRRYWAFHRHPLLIFPNAGRGEHTPQALAQRMRQATAPMPCSSLQRLIVSSIAFIRACSTMGVVAGSALRGLRSNTPFNVRPSCSHCSVTIR